MDDMEEKLNERLPKFADACKENADTIIMSNSAFGETEDELKLLGMAVKFAGKFNKNITIMGGE